MIDRSSSGYHYANSEDGENLHHCKAREDSFRKCGGAANIGPVFDFTAFKGDLDAS